MDEGTRFKARPTTYNGVEMRSRLEAKYAAWLDRQQITWEYEPQCFATDEGQYLPDFRLHGVKIMGSNRRVYVEVKPLVTFGSTEALRWARIIWASEPHAFLLIEVRELPDPLLVLPRFYGESVALRATWTRFTSSDVGLALHMSDRWREVA